MIKQHLERFLAANDQNQTRAIANVMFWAINEHGDLYGTQRSVEADRFNEDFEKAGYTREYAAEEAARYLIRYGTIPTLRTVPRLCLELGFVAAAMEAQRWINSIDNSK